MLKDKTITAFVVDDEQMVRELLIGMIEWDRLGIKIIGDSGSAMEALDLIENDVPDIVFIDINMPFVDGLKLAGILTERYPDIRIIILTGCQSFASTQKSIRIGVADYITKPISAEEVTESLLKVKKEILDWYSERSEVDSLRALLAENRESERERIFRDLLYIREDARQLEQKLMYLGVRFRPGKFQVALVQPDEGTLDLEDTEYRYLVFLYCIDAVKSYLMKREDCYVFSDITGKVAVLFNGEENIIPVCQRLKTYLDNAMKCTVNIGIGKAYSGLEGIRSSYCQAADALKYKSIAGGDSVVCFSEFEILKQDDTEYDIGSADFEFRLKAGMEEQAVCTVRDFFDRIGSGSYVHPNTLHVVGSEFVSSLQKICAETGIDILEISRDGGYPYEQILRIDNIPVLADYLEGLIRRFIARLLAMRNSIQTDTVEEIKKYIDGNICDYTLSLTSVAEAFDMNPSYISRLFKQKTSCNFSKYIMAVRIDRAVEIIQNGNQKVYEIAEQTGFIDPHYFGVCFRKVTGMSVSEYRDSLAANH